MRVGFLFLAFVFLALTANTAFAQDPSTDEILGFARSHATTRMVHVVRKNLQRSWPPGAEKAGAFLKRTGLEKELILWFEAILPENEQVKSFADRTVEVWFQVPFHDVASFLNGTARRKNIALEAWQSRIIRDLHDRSRPFAKSTGVGIPEGVAWALGKVKPDPTWQKIEKRVGYELGITAYRTALRNLSSKASALRVGEGRTVGEFLKSIGVRERDLAGHVGEMVDDGSYRVRYLPMGRCERDLFIDLIELYDVLQLLIGDSHQERRLSGIDFEHLIASNGGKRMLKSTGFGIHKAFLADVPEWFGKTLEGEGSAHLPANAPGQEQAVSMAYERAAKIARKKLIEKILALRHKSGKTLGDLAGDSEKFDLIRELVGQAAGERHKGENRVYYWSIKIPLENVWDLVKDWR